MEQKYKSEGIVKSKIPSRSLNKIKHGTAFYRRVKRAKMKLIFNKSTENKNISKPVRIKNPLEMKIRMHEVEKESKIQTINKIRSELLMSHSSVFFDLD